MAANHLVLSTQASCSYFSAGSYFVIEDLSIPKIPMTKTRRSVPLHLCPRPFRAWLGSDSHWFWRHHRPSFREVTVASKCPGLLRGLSTKPNAILKVNNTLGG